MRLFTFKLLVVSVVAGALMLVGSGAAFASTGNQNPDFIVSVDLAPDVAHAGDRVSVSGSVTNTTWRYQYAQVCLSVSVNDTTAANICYPALVPPKRTISLSYSFILPSGVPGATIAAGLSVSNSNGTSSASDSITLS